ncbi:protein ripply2 [Anomaloglossus baeobatrachus]|uniref:protein ripply2 n=1 Tax=Anomaloglossus baeobatrachus TaxID=238106 RepID=UPI003F50A818
MEEALEPRQSAGQRVSAAGSTGHTAGRCGTMWRPWSSPPGSTPSKQPLCFIQDTISDKVKLPAFQHPVKLFWPKSKCYDFLYQEAEELLRNFPVQATIAFYQESDSSASEDEETYEN